MNDLLRDRLDAQHGVVTAHEAQACGVARESLSRLVAQGVLVRVHPGCFVEAARLVDATTERRHALCALAVTRSFEGRHAASHVSALAVHGLPLVGVRQSVIHLTWTTPGRGRRTREVVIHPASRALPVHRVAGVLAVPPELAIVQATSCAGLVRSESPGESRARVLFRAVGLPLPVLQAEIRDEDGWLVGYVDFLFARHRTIVEFDGLLKYGEATARSVLVAEKHREDRLRSLGYEVVRLTWADLSRPDQVDRSIRSAFARQARRAS